MTVIQKTEKRYLRPDQPLAQQGGAQRKISHAVLPLVCHQHRFYCEIARVAFKTESCGVGRPYTTCDIPNVGTKRVLFSRFVGYALCSSS